MNSLPRVSVVMPVLNEAESVSAAISSVLQQSWSDLELLVVDGRSTDDTLAIVSALAADEPRIRVLDNPERTIPQALNVALAHARGEFLARVDGHATVSRTYLERAVAELDADPEVAAVGGKRIGVARTASGAAVATALSSKFGVGDSINHYADTVQDTDHASFGVFRVAVLRSIGGWDVNLLVNEDVDLDHRILGQGHRIRFDPEMEIYWHVRESVSALARQYRRYGRGKAAMVLKNGPDAVRVRHLAPPALVMGLGGAAGAALARLWPVSLLLAGPYAAAVGVATALTLRSSEPVAPPDHPLARPDAVRPGDGPTGVPDARTTGAAGRTADPVRLAASFVAMHVGWGLGFLEGAVLRLPPASASAKVPPEAKASR